MTSLYLQCQPPVRHFSTIFVGNIIKLWYYIVMHSPITRSLFIWFSVVILISIQAHAHNIIHFWVSWVLILNIITFFLMGKDKAAAAANAPRTPEASLLILSLWGGSIGTLAGRKLFRHKSQKQAFYGPLFGIIAIQAIALIYGIFNPHIFSYLPLIP